MWHTSVLACPVPHPSRRAQREASITAALQREGLSGFNYAPGVSEYIRTGTPSEAQVLAACRQQHEEQQAAQQAAVERTQRITAWLAEQQMPDNYRYIVRVVDHYILGACSEAEAQQACLRQQAEDQAREQRRQEVSQLLEGEGLPARSAGFVSEAQTYIRFGGSSLTELLAAAQAQHAREQRSAALVAALTAEGLGSHLTAAPAARAYISTGDGSQEAALAACRAQHQRQLQIIAHRTEVVARLPPGVLYESCEGWDAGSLTNSGLPEHAACPQ